MHKIVLGLITLSFFILVFLYFQPINLEEKNIVFSNDVNEYLLDMGLDERKLLNTQKLRIIDESLSYIKSFTYIDYISSTVNSYLYQRNWQIQRLLEYQGKTNINLMGNLFIDKDENYHIMINYELPIDNNKGSYFELDFSNQYQLRFLAHENFFIYNNQEYINDNSYHNYDLDMKRFELSLPTFKQYFKHPVVKGYYHYKFESDEMIDNSYFSLLINVFESITSNDENIVLGFNSFRTNPNQIKYVPRALKVTYYKEGF